MTAAIATSEAGRLRTVLPVVVDYVNHIVDGADLDGLRQEAIKAGAVEHLPLIDALIAAREAAYGKAGTAPDWWHDADGDMAAYRGRLMDLANDAMVQVVMRPGHPDVPLATREAMAEAVIDALTADGYVVTYVGGAA
ncbi:hypothetical protein ACU635_50830 [[Actinomadura] parvosata]|uniref:hypothetical protein n=1 Tax=[Actinomadura] parvosata TaxID=1955412 RepID=UPI00406C9AE1